MQSRTRHCNRISILLVASLVLLISGLSAANQTAATGNESLTPSEQPYVQFTGELLTVKAHDVSIRTLLEDIALHSGLVLVLHGPLDEYITMELERLPFPEAIGRVLHDRNFALHYSGPASGTLWVFPSGGGENHTFTDTHVDQSAVTGVDGYADLVAFHHEGNIGSLTVALASSDAKVRLESVTTLGDLGTDEATAALALALKDSEPSVRLEAVDALGDIDSEYAIQVLEPALTDPEREIREAAAEIVQELTDRQP